MEDDAKDFQKLVETLKVKLDDEETIAVEKVEAVDAYDNFRWFIEWTCGDNTESK